MIDEIDLISTKRVLVSLIKSIDAYNSLLKDHHRRVTAYAFQLGAEYGLSIERLSKLVIAASIHDIGAIHVRERDELTKFDVDDPEPHALNGARILNGIPCLEGIQQIIRYHHVRYRDTLTGQVDPSAVPEECWFLHLADRIDIYSSHFGDSPEARETARNEVRTRFGKDFLPELTGAFERATDSARFWHNADELMYQELLLDGVDTAFRKGESMDLESIALLFSRIVDFKSHWTMTHSLSVGAVAARIGAYLGLPGNTQTKLRIAGYLHDIGKIAVPAEILEKPGPLNEDETGKMQDHALFSSLILSGNDELAEIGRWAGSHHERRDRSGYPLKAGADRFETETDIIAYADVFTALLEDRPYRGPVPADDAMVILKSLSPQKLSQKVFSVISANFGELVSVLETESPLDGLSDERDFVL